MPRRTDLSEGATVRVRAFVILGLAVSAGLAMVQTPRHLNPVIDLVAQQKPVFGLYAPANPRGRGGRGAATTPPAAAPAAKTPAQLALDALADTTADYIFDGTMEGNFDRGYTAFVEFAKGMAAGGVLQKTPYNRLRQPLFVKTPKIADDVPLAVRRIGQQLNTGASGIVFVDVESGGELKAGIAAMRFRANGGTRADDVGDAPAYWGMSEREYRAKADLWPLNPNGELYTFTIVESMEGLNNVRDIAAVPGVGVLFPGAGTLRGVFTTTGANGERNFDAEAWEAAIQKVLAACKEFRVPCGYPAGEADIEMRMQQGFSVFVIGWGEPGFRAVNLGRKAAGR